jgi:hypothetical protein
VSPQHLLQLFRRQSATFVVELVPRSIASRRTSGDPKWSASARRNARATLRVASDIRIDRVPWLAGGRDGCGGRRERRRVLARNSDPANPQFHHGNCLRRLLVLAPRWLPLRGDLNA